MFFQILPKTLGTGTGGGREGEGGKRFTCFLL